MNKWKKIVMGETKNENEVQYMRDPKEEAKYQPRTFLAIMKLLLIIGILKKGRTYDIPEWIIRIPDQILSCFPICFIGIIWLTSILIPRSHPHWRGFIVISLIIIYLPFLVGAMRRTLE